MADETTPAMGMSVGATALAAVTADRAVTRTPVLTLYRRRSSEVGVPSENPNLNPDIGEPGLVITDFVDRVGDPAPVVATDGSTHRAEQLLADGLHALAYVATQGRPLPPAVAVTHPAHWPTTAVDALRAALSQVPEWSQRPVSLISDVAAALTALQANPGLPANGIIAVCDFGGSGTSFTLVDAARGHRPVGATVRHTDFSGAVIDQALLNHVVDDLSAGGSLDGTLAIGSLTGLRAQSRNAKEHLSANTVTELTVDLPGFHGGVWVTRAELDEAIRQPLDDFLAAVPEILGRSGIRATDLAAVVSVGGGANIAAITTGLSQRLGVAVISWPRPQMTAAIGAALGTAGSPAGTTETAAAPIVTMPAPAVDDTTRLEEPSPVADTPAGFAWPEADDSAKIGPAAAGARPGPPGAASASAPPEPTAEHEPVPDKTGRAPWYRGPMAVILGIAVVVLAAGAVAVIALRNASGSEPATPAPGVSTEPTTLTSVIENPLTTPPSDVQTSAVTEPPPPESQTETVSPPPTTTSELTTITSEPTTPSEQPVFPGIPTVPPLPPIPGPVP
jgi:hypothetical protein